MNWCNFEEQLGGGFKYGFIFTPIWGKIPILTHMDSNGLVQPPTRQHRTTPFVVLANFQEVRSNKNDPLKAPSLEYVVSCPEHPWVNGKFARNLTIKINKIGVDRLYMDPMAIYIFFPMDPMAIQWILWLFHHKQIGFRPR